MVSDEQTHTLPPTENGLSNFRDLQASAGRDDFAEALLCHLRNVQRHYATLFEHARAGSAGRPSLIFPPAADDRETLDRLSVMGFRNPLEISALVRRWNTSAYGALKGTFAREQLAASCRRCFTIFPVPNRR